MTDSKDDTGQPELKEQSVKELVNNVAARTPAPGGGSVASVAGALGASLLHMIGSFSIDESSEDDDGHSLLLEEFKQCAQDLLDLAEKDRTAYEAYQEIRQDDDCSEREERSALEKSTRIPIRIGSCCEQLIGAYLEVREELKPSFQADIRTALELIRVNWASANDLAKYNIEQLPDGTQKTDLREELRELQQHLETLFEQISYGEN